MRIQPLTYRTATGWTPEPDPSLDGEQTLVLVFAAPEFAADPAPLQALARAFPRARRLGCSTAGEIAGPGVHDASISAAVVRFDRARLAHAVTTVDGAGDSAAAGARLAAALPHESLQAVFVLSDGLHVNGTALVDALVQRLPPGVAVTGGLAGDGSRFASTWVLAGEGAAAGHVGAIGLYGDSLCIGHGCDGGWQDFGPERRITRVQGNVLYELDGRPALELYKTYLGDLAAGLPGTALLFPLSVRRDGQAEAPLVRTVLAVDEASQSMTFAGDLPPGGLARLMRAHGDQLIDSAAQAAQQALGEARAADGGPALVVSVSCVGRRLVLGQRTDEELESVLDAAPPGSVHLGFYSYGEISPRAAGGVSELHNQTMTVTVLRERLAA
jgi:hypothetical protein